MDKKSFWTGYMMGDTSYTAKPLPRGKKAIIDVPLQTVIWCQVLSNLIDALDKYVEKFRPEPDEFMRCVLNIGEIASVPVFADTPDNKEKIMEREQEVVEYSMWLARYTKSGTLLDDDDRFTTDYKSLSAVRRIWQEPKYTPDFENLNLLFGYRDACYRYNGRIYDRSTSVEYPAGLAKHFFEESVAARVLKGKCNQITQNIVEWFGRTCSYMSINFRVDTWSEEAQCRAYKQLLKCRPDVCKTTWSIMSRQLYNELQNGNTTLSKSQMQSTPQTDESNKIFNVLDEEERKQYASASHRKTPNWGIVFPVVVLFPLILMINLCFLTDADIGTVMAICFGLMLGGGLIVFIAMTISLRTSNDTRCKNYITDLQQHYYAYDGSSQAKEYAKLLERVNKTKTISPHSSTSTKNKSDKQFKDIGILPQNIEEGSVIKRTATNITFSNTYYIHSTLSPTAIFGSMFEFYRYICLKLTPTYNSPCIIDLDF